MRLQAKYRKRWAKLMDHMNELPRRKFDWGVWTLDRNDPTYEGGFPTPSLKVCSTIGCVAGWMPAIFPRYWHIDNFGDPTLKDSDYKEPTYDFAEFMGIPGDLANNLLVPEVRPNSPPEDCTPKQWLRFAKKVLREAEIEYE